MATRELPDFLDNGALKYPGIKSKKHPRGKTYVVQPADSDTGLRLASLGEMAMQPELTAAQRDRLNLDDGQEFDLYTDVLGDTLTEMRTDGVDWPRVQQIAQDAFAYWYLNPEVADAILASQGKALTLANRADKRAATKAAAKKAPAKKAATKPASARSPRKATSRSNQASTATKARTASPASTRSSKTSATSAAKPRTATG